MTRDEKFGFRSRLFGGSNNDEHRALFFEQIGSDGVADDVWHCSLPAL